LKQNKQNNQQINTHDAFGTAIQRRRCSHEGTVHLGSIRHLVARTRQFVSVGGRRIIMKRSAAVEK